MSKDFDTDPTPTEIMPRAPAWVREIFALPGGYVVTFLMGILFGEVAMMVLKWFRFG